METWDSVLITDLRVNYKIIDVSKPGYKPFYCPVSRYCWNKPANFKMTTASHMWKLWLLSCLCEIFILQFS